MKRIIYTLASVMLSVGAWAQTTLQEQINNATDGATITLTENVTIDKTILINRNITIDGAGYTITSSVTNNLGTFYVNVPTSNFNITNATIDGNNNASMAVCAYRGVAKSDLTGTESVVNNNTGNIITLTDCSVKNFTGYPNSYVGAVYAFSTSTVNLTNCTFTGNTTSKSTNGASGADVWAGAAATVNISGGSYQEVFVNSNASDHASITISGGATVAELAVCVTENGGSTNQPAIKVNGATVTNIATETGNLLPASAVTIENGGKVNNIPTAYVAQIGDKKYSSLPAAIEAATAGATITLLANISTSKVNDFTITKALTLNLDGHKITSTVEEPFIVKATGDLTITGNGTIAGPTDEDGKVRDGKAMITVEGGKLTYLNGTLTCGGVGPDGMYGVYILDNGTAVFGDDSDKTGPSITSWFAAIGENNTTAPANITVYGGSYTSQASPTDSDWWSYFCAPVYAAASGAINIYGGAFNGYYSLSSRYGNVDQNLNIQGGTFTGTKQALFIDNKSGVESSASRNVAVSGGTFSSAVPAEYCADGFVPKDNGDGTFGVKEGTYVAQIGDVKYESLQEAVSAATSGQEITLLANVTVNQTILIDKNITIDGNNHTISSSVTNKLGMFYINTNTCNFTIQNATLEGNNVASMAVVAYRGVANDALDGIVATDNNNDGNNITLTNCNVQNFTGWPGSYVGAVYGFSHSHLTLNNCNFTGNTTSLSTNGASGADVWTGAATTVIINGGTYNEVFVNTNSSNTETVTINGGASIEELAICVSYREDGSTNIPHLTIDNATVNTLTTEKGNPIPAEGITFHNGGSITNKPATEIAKIYNGINTKAYATIDDALDAVKNDETITLLADVTIATINVVNGKTIAKNGHEVYVTSFVVTDGEAANIPFDFVATTATYTRNIGENVWGTVCIPFTLKSCDAYTLYQVENIDGSTLNVNEVAGDVAPGTPVIFKKNSTDGNTITFTTSDANVKKEGPTTGVKLVGTYTNKTINSGLENIYFINGDMFHQAKASLTVPAYRAYINNTSAGAKASVLNIVVAGGEVNGIEAVTSDATVTAIYDANGRQLTAPQKGMNIMKLANGKTVKLMIK